MLMAIVLAAVTGAPAASPSPAPLTPLKVIGSVRSTPFCTALHETIGPAIAGVLSNDDLIATSKPAFAKLYHDDVLARSEARTHFDVYALEKLIGPIVANVKRVDTLLDAKSDNDPKLKAMREKLKAVVAQQKESLNVISGFVATEQLGELQNDSELGNWQSALVLGGQSQNSGPSLGSAPAAGNLFSAGVHNRNPGPRDPSYNANNVGPTYDPFAPLVTQIEQQRAAAQSSESDAAKLVAAALTECAP